MENKNINLGDVFYSNWGYEQTNVSFYKVVALVGKKSVKVVEVGSKKHHEGCMYGTCTPILENVIGEPFTKKLLDLGKEAILNINPYETAYLWDKSPINFSSDY